MKGMSTQTMIIIAAIAVLVIGTIVYYAVAQRRSSFEDGDMPSGSPDMSDDVPTGSSDMDMSDGDVPTTSNNPSTRSRRQKRGQSPSRRQKRGQSPSRRQKRRQSPIVVIRCGKKNRSKKTVTVVVRSNPKNTPMKLFSPQKPGNKDLVKYNIVKGKITVGPLAWMKPKKKTIFVVAKNRADYRAGKFIARCVTKDRR